MTTNAAALDRQAVNVIKGLVMDATRKAKLVSMPRRAFG